MCARVESNESYKSRVRENLHTKIWKKLIQELLSYLPYTRAVQFEKTFCSHSAHPKTQNWNPAVQQYFLLKKDNRKQKLEK